MTIIIETPAPPTRERLVLVPEERIVCTEHARDATPADLERAGLVLREQAAPGTLAHLRADLRDMTARAEGAERLREECESVLTAMGARAREAEEFARVLEVERDALLAELADAKAERDRAIRDCAATAAERNEARAELARLTAPAEGEPSFEHLRDCWDMAPRADASGSDVFRNGFFALYRLGVAHERARQQPAQDRATDEELERAFYAAYDPLVTNGRGAIEGRSAGLLAVAARVRQERCLIARAVAANVDVRVCEDNDGGFMVGVHETGCDEELARCVPASDVPATLARLLGEVER